MVWGMPIYGFTQPYPGGGYGPGGPAPGVTTPPKPPRPPQGEPPKPPIRTKTPVPPGDEPLGDDDLVSGLMDPNPLVRAQANRAPGLDDLSDVPGMDDTDVPPGTEGKGEVGDEVNTTDRFVYDWMPPRLIADENEPNGYRVFQAKAWIRNPDYGKKKAQPKPPPEPDPYADAMKVWQAQGRIPSLYPGAQEGLARRGNEATRGFYTPQGQFIGHGESLGPWEKAAPPESKTVTDPTTGITYIEDRDARGNVKRDILGRPPKPEEWADTGQIEDVSLTPGQKYPFLVNEKNPEGYYGGLGAIGKLQRQTKGGESRWQLDPSNPNNVETLFNIMTREAGERSEKQTKLEDAAALQERAIKQLAAQQATAAGQALERDPRSWIMAAGRSNRPLTVPSGAVSRLTGQAPGAALQKVTPQLPSPQEWSVMSDDEKEQLMGYLEWLGISPSTWMLQLSQRWNPPRQGAVNYTPVRQR